MYYMSWDMRAASLIPTILALTLAGCNGVPLTTQWKLRHFNLGTADVAKLRVALRAPDWATPTPDKAVIEATRTQDDGERKLAVHLRRARHADDATEVARVAKDMTPLAIYEIAPNDLAAVRSFQEETAKATREGATRKSDVKIGRGVACRNGAVPAGPIPIDVYLHPDDETGWLPLLEGFDLRPQIRNDDDMRAFDDSVPLCGKHTVRVKLPAAQ
jgi:hypothetical protein